MKFVLRENVSVAWMSLPLDDFVRTRVFPQARDWRVRSISLSSTQVRNNTGEREPKAVAFLMKM